MTETVIFLDGVRRGTFWVSWRRHGLLLRVLTCLEREVLVRIDLLAAARINSLQRCLSVMRKRTKGISIC